MYASDYQFQQEVIKSVRGMNDGSLAYTPARLYQDLSLYLPFRFGARSPDGKNIHIHITSVSDQAQHFGYRRDWSPPTATSDARNYVDYEVVKIDGVDAVEAIKQFASQQYFGLTSDEGARFNLALHSEFSHWGSTEYDPTADHGAWACAFGARQLSQCPLPASATVKFDLIKEDGTGAITVSVPWTVRYAGSESVNCTDVACMKLASAPNVTFNTDICQDYASYRAQFDQPSKMFGPDDLPSAAEMPAAVPIYLDTDSSFLELLDTFPAATGYLHTDEFGVLTGVLALRQFERIAVAVHVILYQFNARNVSRVIVDLRGNGFGSKCQAYELAYLLSGEGLIDGKCHGLFDVRASPLMESVAKAEAGENVPGRISDRPIYQLNPPQFERMAGTGSPAGSLYNNASWYTNQRQLTRNGKPVNFSQIVGRHCEDDDTLLRTGVGGCPAAGVADAGAKPSEFLRTDKQSSWSRDKLILLSDGRCGAACAVFVSILQEMKLATTVAVGGLPGKPPRLGSFAGGIASDANRMVCQMAVARVMPNGSLNFFPSIGQMFAIPIAAEYSMRRGAGGGWVPSDLPIDLLSTPADFSILYNKYSVTTSDYSPRSAFIFPRRAICHTYLLQQVEAREPRTPLAARRPLVLQPKYLRVNRTHWRHARAVLIGGHGVCAMCDRLYACVHGQRRLRHCTVRRVACRAERRRQSAVCRQTDRQAKLTVD
jgi:hypothetical protein